MVARVEGEIIGSKRGQQDFGLCFENGEAEEALIVSRCVTQLSVSVSLCAQRMRLFWAGGYTATRKRGDALALERNGQMEE